MAGAVNRKLETESKTKIQKFLRDMEALQK